MNDQSQSDVVFIAVVGGSFLLLAIEVLLR